MAVAEQNVIAPKNMQVSVVRYDDGSRLFVGGQLTEEQNHYEMEAAVKALQRESPFEFVD